VEFSYRLTGFGWGLARVSGDSGQVALGSSYLSDVLGDLVEAIGVLLEGSSRTECSWSLEPGEYRWIFERPGSQVHLRILAFDDFWPPQPEENGTLVFETCCPLRQMASAVAKGLDDVLAKYGEDEYLRLWVEHPFPTEMLTEVKELIASLPD
jgi:hypothetical protein